VIVVNAFETMSENNVACKSNLHIGIYSKASAQQIFGEWAVSQLLGNIEEAAKNPLETTYPYNIVKAEIEKGDPYFHSVFRRK